MTTGHDAREGDENRDRGENGSDGAAAGREILDPEGPCMACGAPNARIYASPDGPARLCPPCATLNGLGCP